jgi:hypothetical protein
VYCNEEKTRTFIGLTVAAGHKSLIAAVNILNKCLADFRLPPFYKVTKFIFLLHIYREIPFKVSLGAMGLNTKLRKI